MRDLQTSWQATSRGGAWAIYDPRQEDVFLQDIAAGLSRNCRYSGQISEEAEFLSVAEHSLVMTSWAIQNGLVKTRLEGLYYLLHDAAEAFLGDIPTPLKALVPEFRAIEDRYEQVILSAFGISPELHIKLKPDMKQVDVRIRFDEREAVILEPALSAGLELMWQDDPNLTPLDVVLPLSGPSEARRSYLSGFRWVLENLPHEGVNSPAAERAMTYLENKGIIAELPDFSRSEVFSPEL